MRNYHKEIIQKALLPEGFPMGGNEGRLKVFMVQFSPVYESLLKFFSLGTYNCPPDKYREITNRIKKDMKELMNLVSENNQ